VSNKYSAVNMDMSVALQIMFNYSGHVWQGVCDSYLSTMALIYGGRVFDGVVTTIGDGKTERKTAARFAELWTVWQRRKKLSFTSTNSEMVASMIGRRLNV
jgi:hypothetical protein